MANFGEVTTETAETTVTVSTSETPVAGSVSTKHDKSGRKCDLLQLQPSGPIDTA